jgi:hypothetical protein
MISTEAAVVLQLGPEALKPLVEQVVAEVLTRMEEDRANLNGRLAYGEPEAAALLGLRTHQLRDERRRGRIEASEVVGGRVRYLRADLEAYLMARRWQHGQVTAAPCPPHDGRREKR